MLWEDEKFMTDHNRFKFPLNAISKERKTLSLGKACNFANMIIAGKMIFMRLSDKQRDGLNCLRIAKSTS